MQPDPWQQWQSFAALFNPAGAAGTHAGPGEPGASPFSPFTGGAERFMAAARAYMDGAAHASAPQAAEAARAFGDSVREIFADVQLPWNLGMGAHPAKAGAPFAFAADSPALGASREHQQRWQRMADAWRRLHDAQRRLQLLWSDAMREAAASFAARLEPSNPPDVSAEALHKIYDRWIDCAEDAYARTAHGESFCNALAQYVNAGSQWRRELQASIEHSSKLLDLPARSEVNALAQRLKSVEEELRALRRELKPKPTPKPKAAAARRPLRKRKA